MIRTSGRNRHFWLAGKREPAQDLFFREALDPALWAEGSSELWSTCWYTGMPAPEVFEQLGPGCTINHIPGNNGLTVKSSLYATLARTRTRVQEQAGADSSLAHRMDFFPLTFVMPTEYAALQDAAAREPGKHWILKPKNSARGKGISLVGDPADVPRDNRFMVQEYMDQPHTIDGHKYVLRLYVLITSVEPLRVYLYQEGSAKLASEPYDADDPDNIYAHLTNPDVNATNTASQTPVVFISFANYRNWLREQGHDDAALFQRIRDMLTLTIISVREHMRSRLQRVKAPTGGCYELLGIDCLVDANLKPHILECNLSPSLDVCAAPQDGGDVEARNKRQLITDMVNLLGLNAPPVDHSDLDPAERIRAMAQLELERAGGFQRLFPSEDVARFLPYFPHPRLADMVLANAVSEGGVPAPYTKPRQVAEIVEGDGLSLYSERTGTLYQPNGTASWIWLMATDGMDADTIADQLLDAAELSGTPEEAWRLRQQVWDTLADWARDGLLMQAVTEATPNRQPVSTLKATDSTHGAPETGIAIRAQEITVRAGAAALALSTGCEAVAKRVFPAYAPMLAEEHEQAEEERLHIVSTPGGYAVSDARQLLGQDLSLAEVATLLDDTLLRRAVGHSALLGLHGTLLSPTDFAPGTKVIPSVLVIHSRGERPSDRDRLAACLSRMAPSRLSTGMLLSAPPHQQASSIGLPCLVPQSTTEDNSAPSGSRRWALLPANTELTGSALDVRAVLVETASAPAGTGAMTARQALAHVLPWCIGSDNGNLSAAAVSALHAWLDARPVHAVAADEAGLAAAGKLLESVAAADTGDYADRETG